MRLFYRAMVVISSAAALSACNGQLYHGQATNDAVTKNCGAAKGVSCGAPYYRLVTGVQSVRTTALVDDKGKLIATASGVLSSGEKAGRCEPVTSEQVVTIADTTHEQIVWYSPGLLETVKFSVTYNQNGTLASVGTEATPDQGKTFSNIAAGVSSLATAATGILGGGNASPLGGGTPSIKPPRPSAALPACNSAPTNITFRPLSL